MTQNIVNATKIITMLPECVMYKKRQTFKDKVPYMFISFQDISFGQNLILFYIVCRLGLSKNLTDTHRLILNWSMFVRYILWREWWHTDINFHPVMKYASIFGVHAKNVKWNNVIKHSLLFVCCSNNNSSTILIYGDIICLYAVWQVANAPLKRLFCISTDTYWLQHSYQWQRHFYSNLRTAMAILDYSS